MVNVCGLHEKNAIYLFSLVEKKTFFVMYIYKYRVWLGWMNTFFEKRMEKNLF